MIIQLSNDGNVLDINDNGVFIFSSVENLGDGNVDGGNADV